MLDQPPHAGSPQPLRRARRRRPAPKPAPAPPTPLEHTEPGWDRVSDMASFVHVADVAASIAFYARLGFQARATYPAGGQRLDWVSLQADQARLMLAHADAPIDPGQQAVLFYLYARDLFGLRERLLDDGVHVGEVRDGTPGPKLEMRREDPDGYVLMIAQIEDDQVTVDTESQTPPPS